MNHNIIKHIKQEAKSSRNAKNKGMALALLLSAFFVFIAFSPYSINAQSVNFDTPSAVSAAVQKIATFMSTLLVAGSVIVIIIAGFIYLTAGGDTTKVETATKTLTYAVIGIIVGFVAFSIPKLIGAILT